MQVVAQTLDLGLGLEHGRLGEFIGLVEVGLVGVDRVGLRFGGGEGFGGGRAALPRCLEGVRVTQHLAPNRCEPGCGGIGLTREP